MAKVAAVTLAGNNDVSITLKAMDKYIDQAAEQGVDLIVFPEMFLQGLPGNPMGVDAATDVATHNRAEYIPEGPSTQYLIKRAQETNMYICYGMIEKDKERIDADYNAAALVGPEGFVGSYRKVHNNGASQVSFFAGTDFPVFDTRIGKIGILICYDKTFPESARVLALKGAEMIICPTAWPGGVPKEREGNKELLNYERLSMVRAFENNVFFVSSDWPAPCAGHSHIYGPGIDDLRATTGFDEGMAVAEFDIQKEVVEARHFAMGGCNLLKDRRPDMYEELVKLTAYNPLGGLAKKCQ